MTNNLAKSLFRKMNLVGLWEYCELRRPRKSLRRGTKKRKGISIVENLENRRRGADRSLFASKKRSALRQLDRPAEAQKESRPPTTAAEAAVEEEVTGEGIVISSWGRGGRGSLRGGGSAARRGSRMPKEATRGRSTLPLDERRHGSQIQRRWNLG